MPYSTNDFNKAYRQNPYIDSPYKIPNAENIVIPPFDENILSTEAGIYITTESGIYILVTG